MPSDLATNPLATLMRGSVGPAAAPGSPPPGAAQPSGAAGNPMGALIAKAFANAQGADPGMLARRLTEMITELGEMIPKTLLRFEGVANELSPAIRHLEKALKATQQAAEFKEAKERPPIGFSGARPTQPNGGLQPGMPGI